MPNKCFVYGCKSGYDSCKEKVPLFKAPSCKVLLKKWLDACNREIPKNKGNIFVCCNHFEEGDLIKFSKTKLVGEHNIYKECMVPLKRWKLKDGALPKNFLGKPIPVTGSKRTNRMRIIQSASVSSGAPIVQDLGQEESPLSDSGNQPTSEVPYSLLAITSNAFNEEFSVDCTPSLPGDTVLPSCGPEAIVYFDKIKLPSHWKWIEENRVCGKIGKNNDTLKLSKAIHIEGDGLIYYVNGKAIKNPALKSKFSTHEDLKLAFQQFDETKICPGLLDQQFLKIEKSDTGFRKDKCWRSKNCLLVSSTSALRCIQCKKLGQAMKKKLSRMDRLVAKTKKKYSNLQSISRKLDRRTIALEKSRKETESLRKRITHAGQKALNQAINSLNPQEKMVVQAIMKKASCSNKKSMRYETEFLMECLLLRIRSKNAYQKILERNLLPLPSPSTIRRLLSSMPCTFGLNEFALSSIKRNLEGEELENQYGSVVWDEMSIAEDITFNAQKLQFDGHVDYGDGVVINKHEGQLADHALVLIFRPFKAQWIQPFAVYATKGAASGEVLHELVTKAIVALHQHNAIVKTVVCDGAQPNKKAMQLFGISGALDSKSENTFPAPIIPKDGSNNVPLEQLTPEEATNESRNTFKHTLRKEELIYFFVDIPHIFKCIRNYIFNKKNVQFKGLPIKYSDLILLYETDKRMNGNTDKRIVPKWTDAHMFPTPFQRMTVRFAVQIFSLRAATGFLYYRTVLLETMAAFIGTEYIEQLIRLLNDALDVMNGRCFKNAIRPGTWKKQKAILEELLEALFDTEVCFLKDPTKTPFLSTTTLHALRLTIQSTIGITTELMEKAKYKFVLTGKFNQDCVERFFGIIRSAGGGQEQPTVSSFLHLFRMLCIYYPVNFHVKKGNVDEEEYLRLLTTYEDCMIAKFKENTEESSKLKLGFKEILEDGLKYDEVQNHECTPEALHDYEDGNVNDHIVYDLCGYLLHARGKMIKFQQCWRTIETTRDNLPEKFLNHALVDIRNRGGLKWATPELFYTILAVENVLDEHFKAKSAYLKDSFEDVICKLTDLVLPPIFCSDHRARDVPKFLFEYVVFRFRFKARNKKHTLLGEVMAARHSKRKLAKVITQKAVAETPNQVESQPKKQRVMKKTTKQQKLKS